MSMRWVQFILGYGIALGAGAWPVWALEGNVRTIDGRNLRGHLRLESNEVVVASLRDTTIIRVAWSNLLALQLFNRPDTLLSPPRNGDLAEGSAWQHQDIGPVTHIGQVTVEAGRIQMQGGGSPTGGGGDAFLFAYLPMQGDGEIVARLVRTSRPERGVKAGIMMRSGLGAEAGHVFLGRSNGAGLIQWRTDSGPAPGQRPVAQLAHWLRLRRDGHWIWAYLSTDGQRWRPVDKVYQEMSREILIGCAVAGQDPDGSWLSSEAPTSCLFDHVRTGRGLRHHSFTPQVRLQSGSVIVEDIAYARDAQLHFYGTTRLPSVRLNEAVRLDFQWPSGLRARHAGRRERGALLTTGEFLEGELKQFSAGTCEISTVLLGLRRFDAHHEVVSIFLGEPAPSLSSCEIRTWSGSVWRGRVRSLNRQGLVLEDASVGRVHIPFYAVKELTRRLEDGRAVF